MNTDYDFIIAGAGAAGLSLLTHMIDSGKFSDKKILLVDQSPKIKNDRTWCFWEKEKGIFEAIVFKRWDRLWFHGEGKSALHSVAPYQYKLIRGLDLYEHCFSLIREQRQITVLFAKVEGCYNDKQQAYIIADGKRISARYVFNSIIFERPILTNHHYWMLQHFKGRIIETTTSSFNPGEATLMDFRVSQQHGTAFVYVMPFSPTRALVEYTLFSHTTLSAADYDEGLNDYCKEILNLSNYKTVEEEYGIIPMTNFPFVRQDQRIINIGTAGGQTKPSSGYTFSFIQKQSAALVEGLITDGFPRVKSSAGPKRFRLYDSTLLNILSGNKAPGKKIFSLLFEKNKMSEVFKFLDNETSLAEELRLIRVLPRRLFFKAAIRELM